MQRLATLAGHLGQKRAAPAAADEDGQRHVLIVGGTGLIGRSAAEHFASQDGWLITTVARRALPFSLPGAVRHTHLELDLSDRAATQSAIRGLAVPITHLVVSSALANYGYF